MKIGIFPSNHHYILNQKKQKIKANKTNETSKKIRNNTPSINVPHSAKLPHEPEIKLYQTVVRGATQIDIDNLRKK